MTLGPAVRILVVDDDEAQLAGTARLLRNAGYDVAQASDGLAGLELARTYRPDLMLLDVDMPRMNGLELCRCVKADPEMAQCVVVMLSASKISTDQQSSGLEGGADGYIARPIANRELLARLQAFVRLQQTQAALRTREAQLSQLVAEKEALIAELQQALREVKTLSGLIPICASCKQVRDDQGYWNQVEAYITEHTSAQFSHGICPDCIRILYPDMADELLTESGDPS